MPHRRIVYSWICKACMNPALSRSSVLQHIELEIDFSQELSHVYCSSLHVWHTHIHTILQAGHTPCECTYRSYVESGMYMCVYVLRTSKFDHTLNKAQCNPLNHFAGRCILLLGPHFLPLRYKHMWQSRVEIKVIQSRISIALFSSKYHTAELLLRAGLICAA